LNKIIFIKIEEITLNKIKNNNQTKTPNAVSIIKVNEAPKPAVNYHQNYVTKNLIRPQIANHQRLLVHDLNPTYISYPQADTIQNQNKNVEYNTITLPPYQTRTENLILYKIKDSSYSGESRIIKKSIPFQINDESSNSSNNIESDYNSESFTSKIDSFSTPLDKTPHYSDKFYAYQPRLRPKWQPTYR
jgi:hypothetical protein